MQLKHNAKPGRVTIPIHKGETLSPRLLGNILKQAGLTADEFVDLL